MIKQRHARAISNLGTEIQRQEATLAKMKEELTKAEGELKTATERFDLKKSACEGAMASITELQDTISLLRIEQTREV